MHWLFLLLTCLNLAPGDTRSSASQDAFAQAPALIIDGETVDWRTYGSWLVRFRGEALTPVYVTHRSIAEAAREAGIEVSVDELDARIDGEIERRVAGAFGGDRERWQAEIARLDSNEENLRTRRRAELLPELQAQRLLSARRVVSDQELESEFERRYGRDGRQLWLRAIRLRIQIPTPPVGTPQEERLRLAREARAALRERSIAIRQRVLAGEDFAALVAELSEDRETRSQGGEFGAPFLARHWPQEAIEAVYALGPGETSEPVYGRGHFNLFQVVREVRTELSGVADELGLHLQNRPADAGELESFYAELTARARVELQEAMYGDSRDLDEVVLILNGEQIQRGTFARWMAPLQGQSLAKAFLEDHLVARAARAANVTIAEDSIRTRSEEMIRQTVANLFDGSWDKWRADLARRGTNEERQLRRRALRALVDLRCEALLMKERSIEADVVRAHWEERYGAGGHYLEVRLLLRKTLVPREPGESDADHARKLTELRANATNELAELRERVQAGEDFGVLAERLSDERGSAARGGRVDPPFPLHRWPDEVSTALLRLKPGELTPVVPLTDALCLFELLARRDVPLETVEKELHAELMRRPPSAPERSAFVNVLVERTPWEYFAAPTAP